MTPRAPIPCSECRHGVVVDRWPNDPDAREMPCDVCNPDGCGEHPGFAVCDCGEPATTRRFETMDGARHGPACDACEAAYRMGAVGSLASAADGEIARAYGVAERDQWLAYVAALNRMEEAEQEIVAARALVAALKGDASRRREEQQWHVEQRLAA